jgi:formiminoglutamate deiminase
VTAYWLERAWTGAGPVRDGVRVEVEAGRFTDVRPGPPDGAERLPGLTVPGLANCHSHAFHRALRGRTQRGRGTFWTWREQMYAVAARLTPETYYELARATYREMVSVGITTVGEFHYLHHGPDGTPYDDPNAMSHALLAAARDAGLRIALLDTCYVASGIGAPPEGVQVRFSDGDAERWAARAGALRLPTAEPGRPDAVLGAAIHSVRAVPREQLRDVAAWASGAPLHAHLSEQVAENEACLAAYGATPAEVLEEAGALGPRTSVVHATHLTARDVKVLGGASTFACFCPTTERDLGDGVGPSRRLRDAGSTLTLGSDSQAVVDLFEEMRAVELDERLATQQRGHWTAEELLVAATGDGHRSLGFPDAGRIEVGARADLVTLDTSSVRTAGTGADEGTAVFAASGADVVRVVRDGVPVADAEDRQAVGADLDRVIRALWEA